jgi:hypothetical protein
MQRLPSGDVSTLLRAVWRAALRNISWLSSRPLAAQDRKQGFARRPSWEHLLACDALLINSHSQKQWRCRVPSFRIYLLRARDCLKCALLVVVDETVGRSVCAFEDSRRLHHTGISRRRQVMKHMQFTSIDRRSCTAPRASAFWRDARCNDEAWPPRRRGWLVVRDVPTVEAWRGGDSSLGERLLGAHGPLCVQRRRRKCRQNAAGPRTCKAGNCERPGGVRDRPASNNRQAG